MSDNRMFADKAGQRRKHGMQRRGALDFGLGNAGEPFDLVGQRAIGVDER